MPNAENAAGAWMGTEPAVVYEVWRSGPNPRAADVRLYRELSDEEGPKMLDLCYADKAEGYPDAPIDFYLVRATTTRERVPPKEGQQA